MTRLELTNVVVIGGGMAGQLVQLAMPHVRIFDWRAKAPVDHLDTRIGPQYLWEPIPGVESVSFPVVTLVDGRPPVEAAIRAYKQKIGKTEDGGDWGLQFQHETTGWHSHLPVPKVEYNRHIKSVDLANHCLTMADGLIVGYDVLISTIPLDFFLTLCTIPPLLHSPWKFDPIYMSSGPQSVPTKGMILNYLSNPDDPFYRETVVPGKTFYESLQPHEVLELHSPARRMTPGKIHPHPESEDVLRSLRLFDVHCFGRYATWRPDELAHETWKRVVAWREGHEP